ncbi:MAG: hypothetical protein JW771_01900 [Candidatus Thermoplasmatota archaeon]|nr:hypothetical protein [Candidatus Thermoplasmatota archaeon]
MKKQLPAVILGCIILSIVLSGCQEQQATTSNQFEGVSLKSDVVELVEASLDFQVHYDYDELTDEAIEVRNAAEVKYRFHNIAGKDITVKVTVEFYGAYDNLLYTGGPKTIFLFKDYTDKYISPATNIILYKGSKVTEIDHAIIIAEEI